MTFPTVSLCLYLGYKRKSDGRSQVKIRFHRNGYSDEYIPLPDHYYTPEEYEVVLKGKRLTKAQYTRLDEIRAFESKAKDAIKKHGLQCIKSLVEKEIFGAAPANTLLKEAFDRYVKEKSEKLVKDGGEPLKTSTVEGYTTVHNSLIEFNPKLKRLHDITPEKLTDWRGWMEGRGRSKTTMSIYMRYLRAVFNWEIGEGRMDKSLYPFGRSKSKFTTPSATKRKLAVSLEIIGKILSYCPEPGYVNKGRDFWMLTYLMNGMNMIDILSIKEGDFISEKELHFIREKTRTTSKETKVIRVVMVPLAWEIINRWTTRKVDKDAYLFDVLKPGLTEKQIRAKVQNFNRVVNKHFQKMLDDMDLPKMTTYNARHSFGTVLKNAGIDPWKIKDLYGHSTIETTTTYLGDVDLLEQESIMKEILPGKAAH